MVDSVSVRFKKCELVEKMPLNIFVYSGMRDALACRRVCVLKTLACRGLRVGPSKVRLTSGRNPLKSCVFRDTIVSSKKGKGVSE